MLVKGFPELSEQEIEKSIAQNIKTFIDHHLDKINENSGLYKSLSFILGSILGEGFFCKFNPPNRNN